MSVSAKPLGAVEGNIGSFQDGRKLFAMSENSNADADREVGFRCECKLMVFEPRGHFMRNLASLGKLDFRQEHREFFTAEATAEGSRWNHFKQEVAEGRYDHVSSRMTEGVVHGFEAVKIRQQETALSPRAIDGFTMSCGLYEGIASEQS
ncbi:hypothetical protein SAMN05892877_12836 [Rhizobium subbaraonis]|uniref:Uncharacterized protein n=1 Tax=Rhizobium subbaraonis TaxID=908946 RepID=A0A285UZP0_9HYPH|nr:hypothetical protein SAMN05892877_12836 [Rhizobium subbaraonis]